MPNDVLTAAIDLLADGRDLAQQQASDVLAEIMAGRASEAQAAAFLIALRTKRETVDEVAGLAATMRALATPVATQRDLLVDTAGTGGGQLTYNVSTTAALIAAGAGCAVAKHGNRSATSRSGSADVLEALGARIDLEPAAVGRCIDEVGFGFMFAPAHHAAMRHVAPIRVELGVRTVFNFLGPLTNPAGARRQVIGVADRSKIDELAGALRRLGCDHALVVASRDGLDELSTTGATDVAEVIGDEVRRWTVRAPEVGLPEATLDVLSGGEPVDNAATTRAILEGEPGPRADLALFNAGAAIYVGGRAGTLAEGVEVARETIATGAAARTLDAFVAATREAAQTEGSIS